MSFQFIKTTICAVICSVVLTSQAGLAAVVFTNFGPSFAYDISSGNPVGNSFDGNNYAEGARFTPLSTVNLSSVRIALNCAFGCPGPDPITVTLSQNNGTTPGAVIESFSLSGSLLGAFGVNNSPLLLTSLLNPILNSGTNYWITASATLRDTIAWNLNNTAGTSVTALSSNGGATWISPAGQTPGAFQIDGFDVGSKAPEPASFATCLSGALAIFAARRLLRKKSRQCNCSRPHPYSLCCYSK